MYYFRLLFNSILFFLGGIFTFLFPQKFINLLVLIIILISSFKLISNMFLMMSVKNYKRSLFYFNCVILLGVVSILFYHFKSTFIPIVRISLACFFALDALNRFLCFILTRKDNKLSGLYYIITSILVSIMSFLFFNSFWLTYIFVSLYFIILGLSYFGEFVNNVFSYKLKFIRPVVIPAIVALFLPYLWYKRLVFSRDNGKSIVSSLKKCGDTPDLYITIHVGPKIYSRVGHIDICFENEIYSYGQYDKDSLSFFKIFGDGVLYKVTDREKYYDFVKKVDRKVVIEYGFSLSVDDKKKLRKRIDKLFSNVSAWSSPYDYTYAHKLETELGAKLYKFKSGVLKKYYSMFNNCVLLIDILVGGIVVDKLYSGSFIIPGSYLYYFNEQLKLKKSKVISRNIYL